MKKIQKKPKEHASKAVYLKFAHEKGNGLSNYDAAYAAGRRGCYDAVTRWAERAMLRPEVIEEIRLIESNSRSAAIADRTEILQTLTRHLRGKVSDFMKRDPATGWMSAKFDDPKAVEKMDVIESIKFESESVVVKPAEPGKEAEKRPVQYVSEIKLHSQQGAADRLAKLLKLTEDESKEPKELHIHIGKFSDLKVKPKVWTKDAEAR